jgi:ABC-type amino acid transport substrate-binding protein
VQTTYPSFPDILKKTYRNISPIMLKFSERQFKWYRILLVILSILFSTSKNSFAQLKADTFSQAKQKGEGKLVCSYMNTEGFAIQTESGEVEGICVDIMRAFARYVEERENICLDVRFQVQENMNSFSDFLDEVGKAQGGVFGLGNITITEERKKKYQFSPPFINNISVLITHESVPDLERMTDIACEFYGLQAYTTKGTTSESRLLAIKKKLFPLLAINYIPATDFERLVVCDNQSIFEDQQAIVSIDFIYYFELLKAGMPVKRHITADDYSEQFGLIMPKDSDWAPLMEEFMDEYTSSAEYEESLSRHLSIGAAKALAIVE